MAANNLRASFALWHTYSFLPVRSVSKTCQEQVSDCRQSRFLSLRTSDRRHWCGNPYSPKSACSLTFLPENGFPRQCAHWLGMTCFELCLHIETYQEQVSPWQSKMHFMFFPTALVGDFAPQSLESLCVFRRGSCLRQSQFWFPNQKE